MDFEQSTEETRKTINAWVENKTNGKDKSIHVSKLCVVLISNLSPLANEEAG